MTNLFQAAGMGRDAPRPLADRPRPSKLSDVVGQDHLVGPEGVITRMLAAGRIPSIILWGPPGTGKTTIARLLAGETGLAFEQISAIFSGVADLKKVFEQARIRREQGRGTIVVSPVRSNLSYLASFSEEARRYGHEPSVLLLSCTEEQISDAAAFELRLPADAKVLKVVRLRQVDHKPIGITISWMNTHAFPQLVNQDYSIGSLYDLFEDKLGLSICHAQENIRADLATEDETRLLKLKHGAPVLRMNRTTHIQGELESTIPIEFVEVVFNGSVYSVDVELFRKSGK